MSECFSVGTSSSSRPYVLGVVKFTILTSLSLQSRRRLSFPVVGFKIFSRPNFTLKFSYGT